jgi:hypothetical protein
MDKRSVASSWNHNSTSARPAVVRPSSACFASLFFSASTQPCARLANALRLTNHHSLLTNYRTRLSTRDCLTNRIPSNSLKTNIGGMFYPKLTRGVRRNTFSSSSGIRGDSFLLGPRQKLLRFPQSLHTMGGPSHS